ncbi:hypothetical protein [Mesoflavibacter zeaxanthinifaciens]
MVSQNISLYSWSNGVIMIVIFGIVCLTLIGFAIKFMSGESKQDDTKE